MPAASTSGGWSTYNRPPPRCCRRQQGHPRDWVSVSWPTAQHVSTVTAFFTTDAQRTLPSSIESAIATATAGCR
jgi:beta-galactosidase